MGFKCKSDVAAAGGAQNRHPEKTGRGQMGFAPTLNWRQGLRLRNLARIRSLTKELGPYD